MPFMQTRGGGAPIGHRESSGGGGYGGSAGNPAYSAWDVLNSDPAAVTGYYWIQPPGFSTAKEIWCDMTNYNGGWMMLSYIGAGTTWTVHWQDSPTSSESNSEPKFNANSGTMTSTNHSNDTYGNMGRSFISQCVQNSRSPGGVACYRIQVSGSTYANLFHSVDSGSDYLPAIPQRDLCQSTYDSDPGNAWYRTCREGLTLDSGNGGAGTPAGLEGQCSYSRWGITPANLTGPMGHYNWGYSISPNHSSNTSYPACHCQGWNKDGTFWFKSMHKH